MKSVREIGIVAFMLLAGQGCAHKVSLDPSPSAAEANYPTAEFRAQDQLFHGLGEVALKKGEDLSKVKLEVQGYFEGTIRIDSGFCHIKKTLTYAGTSLVEVALSGPAKESCVIDIVVTTVYPRVYDENTLVYDLKGQLFVKVLTDEKPFHLGSSKVQAGLDTNLYVPVESQGGSVQAIFRGCGSKYDDMVPVNDGEAMISARALAGPERFDRCIYEGFLDMLSGIKRVSWSVWTYDRSFSPLPLPRLDFHGSILRVQADRAVAAIILDEDFELSHKALFRLDPDEEHVLRLLTVKGRSVVCQWLTQRAEWVCRQ